MNIFILDRNPIKAAAMQCDVHVVKMIIEAAQMLSTAHRLLDGTETVTKVNGRNKRIWRLNDADMNETLYAATHWNHPCSKWVRESKSNYQWLYMHYLALGNVYLLNIHNGGKIHATSVRCDIALSKCPNNIVEGDLTPFALAMPDEFKKNDPVMSYRGYYTYKQWQFHSTPYKMKWTGREAPDWVFNYLVDKT